jgi:hypothetical protein
MLVRLVRVAWLLVCWLACVVSTCVCALHISEGYKTTHIVTYRLSLSALEMAAYVQFRFRIYSILSRET